MLRPARRALISVALAVALALAVSLFGAGRALLSGPQVVTSLVPHVPYAVRADAPCLELDLAGDESHCYRFVVASLGPAGPTYPVRFSWRPADAVRTTPIERWSLPENRKPSAALDRPPRPTVPAARGASSQIGRDAGRTPTSEGTPGEPERTFFLHVTDGDLDNAAHYARVAARCVARSGRVRIWLDRQCRLDATRRAQIDEIVDRTESLIPALEAEVAPLWDVDGDGTLGILVTPWLGALQGGRTSLGGFVRAADYRASQRPPFGNQADLLYLNAASSTGSALTTLLAHELTHACAVSARLGPRRSPGAADEDDWIGEALAHLSENRHGGWSNLDHRVARFLAAPSRYPLVVPDYYAAGLWRNHGCRGATWSFHRWCADTYGPDYTRRVALSTTTGLGTLEAATGTRFDDLFRGWTLATHAGTMRRADAADRDGAGDLNGAVGDSTADRSTEGPVEGRVETSGRVGRFEVAGARVEVWQGSEPIQLNLAGTSAACLEWRPPPGGAASVRIEAPAAAELQLTVMKVPRACAAPPVSVRWVEEPERRRGDDSLSADPPLALCVRTDALLPGESLEVATLERFTQTEVETIRFDLRGTKPDDVTCPLERGLRTVVALDRSAQPEHDGPWFARIVARSASGRRRVAWVDLDPPIRRASPNGWANALADGRTADRERAAGDRAVQPRTAANNDLRAAR